MRLARPSLALLVLSACNSSLEPLPKAPEQPVATNTGAFAVVAVGPILKAYVPSSDLTTDFRYRMWVVDAAVANGGFSGHVATIDLGPFGPADAVAAAPDVVVAVSMSYPVIWFIDPSTDTVMKQLALPDRYGAWDVSDRNAFMNSARL